MSDVASRGEKNYRRIKSFVRRSGRKTLAQQAAFDSYWPRKGLLREQGLLDFAEVFSRQRPVILEIGFGMGQSLVAMAKAEPEQDFIGIEVHEPGVGKLLHSMQEQSVENIRIYCDDAVDVLKDCIADASLERVQIYFPDPWHKKKHNKRRLIQPTFIEMLSRKLKPGGIIHLATDWEDYAEQMMVVMTAAQGLENMAGEYAFSERPAFRPVTKFERRGERLGHGVWDLLFQKSVQ